MFNYFNNNYNLDNLIKMFNFYSNEYIYHYLFDLKIKIEK